MTRTPLFVEQVFAMNNFFVCLLLYLTLLYFDTLDTNVARWGAFVMGLGLTNQHTLIVFEGPLMVHIFPLHSASAC